MKYIVDFEGFTLSSTFVIKEFVLLQLNSGKKVHFLLNSPKVNNNFLKSKDRKNISYCENFLHGVRWGTKGQSISNLKTLLHTTLTSEDIVYIKGEEKVKIFCKQLNPSCRVRDINELLTYAEVSKDWLTIAREQMNKKANTCPLYFHKSNPHCSSIKTDIFSRMLLNAFSISKEYSQ